MNEMHKILVRGYFNDSHAVFFVGDIAKKMGLKSSTYLKNILREMVTKDFGVYMIATPQGDYFGYEPMRQLEFEDRMLIINGARKKIAQWVEDMNVMVR